MFPIDTIALKCERFACTLKCFRKNYFPPSCFLTLQRFITITVILIFLALGRMFVAVRAVKYERALRKLRNAAIVT